jgi:transposase
MLPTATSKRALRAVVKVSSEVVARAKNAVGRGFSIMKNRWQVERTYAWLADYRRLDKDHERLPKNSVGMIYLAMIRVMLRRLTGEAIAW